MPDGLPPLRHDLDYIPMEHEDQQFVLVRDPLGIVQEGQAIPMPLFQLIAHLPRGADMETLRSSMAEHSGGQLASLEQAQALINELDQAGLLESRSYLEAKGEVVQAFQDEDTRFSSMAGQAYPAEPDALRTWLEATMLSGGEPLPGQIKAIVAPHIDPGIGAGIYARAYAPLAGADPRRVIVLGVGHQLPQGLYAFTEKSFQTPFGTVPNDTGLIRALSQAAGGIAAGDDFAHRNEHSIEFQLLFLQHLLQSPFSLAPVLCGSLLYGMAEYTRQAFLDVAGPMLEVLREAVAAPDTLLVAGVDFCHLGPKFGHEQTGRELEPETREHDRELLETLCDCDAEGFWQESARVRDRFNVCGFSALATLLEVLPECRGSQLAYEIWHEEPTSSAVSYAAATFSID